MVETHSLFTVWERQSDGWEYMKTLRRPGLRPEPRWGSLQRHANCIVGGEGLVVPSPRTPSRALVPSRSRPFGPRLFYPAPKLVTTPLMMENICGKGEFWAWNAGPNLQDLRQKPVGEQGRWSLPPFPFPFPSPLPFHSPTFQTNQWQGRSLQIQSGGSSLPPPYKYHPAGM